MKVYKNKYGWQTSAHNRDKTIKNWIDFQFSQVDEPNGDYVECNLIFRFANGEERDCFFSSYKTKDGTVKPKLIIMGTGKEARPQELEIQQTLSGDNRDATGHAVETIDISPDELPFY